MLDFKVEPLTQELIEEMKPIQQGYWKEVAGPFHNFPPDVDWQTYLVAQKVGRLRVLVARVNGVVKAGTFIVMGPHPHYACIAASLPLLFVDPEYRRGTEGIRLVKLAIEEAKKCGCQMMMTHGGVHNGVNKLFEFLGFNNFGTYYVMVIGDPVPVFKADMAGDHPWGDQVDGHYGSHHHAGDFDCSYGRHKHL